MSGRIIGAALLPALLLASAAPAARQRTDWHAVASADDRERLREWRDAWQEGLTLAKRAPAADLLAREPVLFDPDDALDQPMPAAGAYRCRMVKLGRIDGSAGLTAGDWGECRIVAEGELRRLERLDGTQRLSGLLYPGGSTRAVFLGTLWFAEEHRALAYGHAAGREMAGLVERIGERRWRLVLPYPLFESKLDVLAFAPAA